MIPDTIIHFTDKDLFDLISSIKLDYGYDFSDYSVASLKRRVSRIMQIENIIAISELKEMVLSDPVFFNKFIEEITVNVTEMFRDPSFYKALIQDVLPDLSRLPVIRIWHAGCSSGEEVYSMAIILKEAGLLDRTLLYATDINQNVLQAAKTGKFKLSLLNEYSENYKLSGGKSSLSDYFTKTEDTFVFNEELSKRMVFSHHNLTTDQSFNEFNLILCRNVLIYFNRSLQNKVFTLFHGSLAPESYLALGAKESIEFSSVAEAFNCTDKKNKIWKLKK